MKTLKILLGLLVVIIVLVVVLVILQETGVFTLDIVETIRTDGLWTTTKNLWLEHVTPFWNEHIQPVLR